MKKYKNGKVKVSNLSSQKVIHLSKGEVKKIDSRIIDKTKRINNEFYQGNDNLKKQVNDYSNNNTIVNIERSRHSERVVNEYLRKGI